MTLFFKRDIGFFCVQKTKGVSFVILKNERKFVKNLDNYEFS